MDWLSLTSEVLSRDRQERALPPRPPGDVEDSENFIGPFSPLEAAALSCALEMASFQLFIVDMGACPSPTRSNPYARARARVMGESRGGRDGEIPDARSTSSATDTPPSAKSCREPREDEKSFDDFRKKVIDIVDETRKELEKKGTFRVLRDRVREEAEAGKAAKLLSKSFSQNQLRIEDLKSKLKGQESAKLEDANDQQKTIASLKDAIHEEITKSDVKLRYIDRWEMAARGQSGMRCRAAEMDLERKLEDTAKKFDAEIRVHDEMCTFLAHEEKVLSEELQRWKETYEKEMKRRTEKIEKLEIRRKEQQILRDSLLVKYEERQQEMEAYLDFKEKIRQEKERERFRSKMATKIQAWWRGTMVRRGLGTFRKKKKAGKEKKKRNEGPAT